MTKLRNGLENSIVLPKSPALSHTALTPVSSSASSTGGRSSSAQCLQLATTCNQSKTQFAIASSPLSSAAALSVILNGSFLLSLQEKEVCLSIIPLCARLGLSHLHFVPEQADRGVLHLLLLWHISRQTGSSGLREEKPPEAKGIRRQFTSSPFPKS